MPRLTEPRRRMEAAMRLNFNPAPGTISGLQHRTLPGIIQIRTCPTGSGLETEIPETGTGRPHRATNKIIPIPGVIRLRGIRRPPGVRPRPAIPRPPGIQRLRVPGVVEGAAVAEGTLAADGTEAAVDTAVVECIPVGAEPTPVVEWPTVVASIINQA